MARPPVPALACLALLLLLLLSVAAPRGASIPNDSIARLFSSVVTAEADLSGNGLGLQAPGSPCSLGELARSGVPEFFYYAMDRTAVNLQAGALAFGTSLDVPLGPACPLPGGSGPTSLLLGDLLAHGPYWGVSTDQILGCWEDDSPGCFPQPGSAQAVLYHCPLAAVTFSPSPADGRSALANLAGSRSISCSSPARFTAYYDNGPRAPCDSWFFEDGGWGTDQCLLHVADLVPRGNGVDDTGYVINCLKAEDVQAVDASTVPPTVTTLDFESHDYLLVLDLDGTPASWAAAKQAHWDLLGSPPLRGWHDLGGANGCPNAASFPDPLPGPPLPPSPPPDCGDGVDNDGDARRDFPGDPGCSSAADTSERGTSVCDNGLDDDGDTFRDHPNDPGCASPSDAAETDVLGCDDGLDNDGDALFDFPADPGCSSATDTNERSPLLPCDDGGDNDGDGLADHPRDPGCAALTDPDEHNASLTCDNGADDDGDTLADFPDDPGCLSPADADERASSPCDDGMDNDGDAKVDYPADYGCTSPTDPSEVNPACKDGLDNDGDGATDHGADPGCASPSDSNERGTTVCDNGRNDDADTLADHPSDPGCSGPADDDELGTVACDDGVDNDGDGRTDYNRDPGCESATDTGERGAPVCDNGLDDDGDTFGDDPLDPGCSGPADSDEHDPLAACDNGADDDADLAADYPADSGCSSPTDPSERTVP